MATRDRNPIDLVCLHGHVGVLQFLFDVVGPNKEFRSLAEAEDPEFDVSVLDVCFAKYLVPPVDIGPAAAGTINDHVVDTYLQPFLEALMQFTSEDDTSPALANAWNKVKVICGVLFCDAKTGRPFPSLALHELFSEYYDSQILSVIPWPILKVCPQQASAADENGSLPLHCFCQHDAGRKLYSFEMQPSIEQRLNERSDVATASLGQISPKNILPLIISTYPKAATTKNRRGRLPLHEAAANKWFDWEDIQTLARVDPETADVADPVTGLFLCSRS